MNKICQRCKKEIYVDAWSNYITIDHSSNLPNYGPAVCDRDIYGFLYEHLPEGEKLIKND